MKITIDLSKINKSKIVERKYTNKEGQEIVAKEYSLDLVPLKAPKFIKEGNTNGKAWTMTKTHFLAETVSKDEKAQGVKGNIVGDGIDFTYKTDFSDIDVQDTSNDIPF
jgi:hypothetical protein